LILTSARNGSILQYSHDIAIYVHTYYLKEGTLLTIRYGSSKTAWRILLKV